MPRTPSRCNSRVLSRIRILLLLPLAVLIACGSGQTATTPIDLSGKWQIAATTVTTNPVSGFLGELQFSAGTVTGELEPSLASFSSPFALNCATGMAQATGTLDAANKLTVAVPAGGGTATITAAFGSDPQTSVNGSYQIVGGSCPMSATPMTMTQYASATGTYIGTLTRLNPDGTLAPGQTSSVIMVLNQATTPDPSGYYPVTGTVTATGYCSESSTIIDAGSTGSLVTPVGPGFAISLDPTASTMTMQNWYFPSAADVNCRWGFTGTLTRQ
jgi:hypothetical protein